MKKFILKTLFILFLITIYFSKDFLYEAITFNNLEVYESKQEYYDIYNEKYLFYYEQTQVLYRDVYNFSKEITVYKGLNYNILEGSAVVDETALIGIISSVDDVSSEVMLLTNKDTVLSVKVGNSYGILKYVDNKLVLTNLTSEEFNIGDNITTSGYSKLYEGLLVGTVETIISSSLSLSYNVTLLGDFNNLDSLLIIKDIKWYTS